MIWQSSKWKSTSLRRWRAGGAFIRVRLRYGKPPDSPTPQPSIPAKPPTYFAPINHHLYPNPTHPWPTPFPNLQPQDTSTTNSFWATTQCPSPLQSTITAQWLNTIQTLHHPISNLTNSTIMPKSSSTTTQSTTTTSFQLNSTTIKANTTASSTFSQKCLTARTLH